jgi:predicted DNA-binding transcriptional regulator AlpA
MRVSEGRHVVEPRGLSRKEAAFYVGVSPTLFDQMVKDGRMPSPKRINTRTVWDKRQLDEAFAALPGGEIPGDEEDWIAAV